MRSVHRRDRVDSTADIDQAELKEKIEHARKHVLGCIRDVERAGNPEDRTRAREGLKTAFNRYFDLLWQSFNFQSRMAHARAGAESRAAEDLHENEIHHMAHVDFDERFEDVKENKRDEQDWKQLEAEYDKTLRAWEGHVQKLFADRLDLIRGEQTGRVDKAETHQTDVLTAHAQNDALALYLDGMIQQAMSSGEAVTISAPSTSSVGGNSLIDTLLAKLGQADEVGQDRKPKSMETGEFNQMLDHLFS